LKTLTMSNKGTRYQTCASTLRNASKIFTDFPYSTNALLRGEQRNTETAAYHLNHLNQRTVKMPRVANPS